MILRSPGLCRLYWAVDSDGQYLHTVKALTEQFGLGAGQVNQLVRNSSQAFSVDRQCPRCEKGFLVQSRTELTQSQRWPVSNYKECQVELAAIRERKTKELEEARRSTIVSTFPVTEENPISVGDLDLRSAMTLGSLIRDGESQESGIIAPLIAHSQQLAPTVSLGVGLTSAAFKQGLILIHPRSPLDAFDWEWAWPARRSGSAPLPPSPNRSCCRCGCLRSSPWPPRPHRPASPAGQSPPRRRQPAASPIAAGRWSSSVSSRPAATRRLPGASSGSARTGPVWCVRCGACPPSTDARQSSANSATSECGSRHRADESTRDGFCPLLPTTCCGPG
jgi:hypothetical protein